MTAASPALLLGLIASTAIGPVVWGGTSGQKKDTTAFRVISFNIAYTAEPFAQRVAIVRGIIAKTEPDLVGLAEYPCLDATGAPLAARFESLGYRVVAPECTASGRQVNSVALLVKGATARETHLWKPTSKSTAVAATLDVPGGRGSMLVVVSCGFGKWQFNEEASREADVTALNRLIQDASKGMENPPLLCGDFDSEPDSASIRFLTGKQSLFGQSTFFRDAWAEAKPNDPGYTWTTNNHMTRAITRNGFHLGALHRRIDYVFSGDPTMFKSTIRMANCGIVGDQPVNGIWASDHYGVLVDVEWIPANIQRSGEVDGRAVPVLGVGSKTGASSR